MKISPEELEKIILELKRDGFTFISLDDLVRIIRTRKKPKNKFIAFTIDDGYKDNFEYGYPIFKKHNTPFCIYITNSFPNQTTDLWWFALENLILQNNTLQLLDGNTLDNSGDAKKKKNFLTLRSAVLNHHFKSPIAYLQQLGKLDFDLPQERKEKCLTWDEIRTLQSDPLVTIGCHTVNHYPLSKLDYKEAESEVAASKGELEARLRKKINHFAFPFGSNNEAGRREYDIARSMSFDSVVTTIHGHVYPGSDLHQLDRIFLIPLHNNLSSLSKIMYWNAKSFLSFLKIFLKR